MYDFLEQNAMYIVLLIALIIWAGLFGYLYKIDRNLKKLEGEESGAVAEGIGVVIGGFGVDKWIIEEKMVKNELQVDAIIVKMGPEESMCQMTKKILKSSEKVIEVLENSILLSEPGTKIMVLGVGNSCGIPNTVKDISKINIKEDIKKGKRGQ